MKFIHLADAHLDSPFRGLSFLPSSSFQRIYHAAEDSLARIVDLALTERVDLVLIAGDTFDSPHPSPHAQVFFMQQLQRLIKARIQVVMILGNHDYLKPVDLLAPKSQYFKLLGANERVETVSYRTKTGFSYQVSGFSYQHNHLTKDFIPDFSVKTDVWHFGLMHGQLKTNKTVQNVYAPFALKEMQALNYDYFALGHIHARRTLSKTPLIVYPGNIQGRQINEAGPKGCYLGEIDEKNKKVHLTFCKTSILSWERRMVSLTKPVSKNKLQTTILQQLQSVSEATFFRIVIKGAEFLDKEQVGLVQDPDYWRMLAQQLPAACQIVGVEFQNSSSLTLQADEVQAFQKAKNSLFTPDLFPNLIANWSKKDPLTQKASQDPNFMQEVAKLTQVKLARELKGLHDAANRD